MFRKYKRKVFTATAGVVVLSAGLLFACQVPRMARLSNDRWEPEYSALFYASSMNATSRTDLESVFSSSPFTNVEIPKSLSAQDPVPIGRDGENGTKVVLENGADAGLTLYRSFFTRDRVLDFYTDLTGSRKIAQAVLQYSDKYDVSVSLSFSIAWAESEYHPRAVNRNVDSIDRGLFQLNSKSFPKLSLNEFFDPETSARYGISYLAYCLSTGGNEVVALAMYNAGPNRVDDRGTPRKTLDYIHKVLVFRENLESAFFRKFSSQIASLDNTGRARFGKVSLDIINRVK